MDETMLTPTTEEAQAAPLDPNAQIRVVDIHFRSGGKVYYFDSGAFDLKEGDHVIIDTARGPEFGTCASGVHTVFGSEIVAPLRSVIRIATEQDEQIAIENRKKEKKAFEVCQEKVLAHGLDMQLVSAEYAFDGSKIIFFFTADGRIDFRELVKNLASVFRTRIELRQIGVRDKAKMVGGLGICGRPFCCSQFLDDFQPVSIKMAKTQNLSLNPTKISGTCGRLMCCLKYEQDAYEDLIKTSPKLDSFVDTPDGRGTVAEVNLLQQSVKVRMENQPENLSCYKNCDICVYRNGKAKKTDPPIPDDWAPISSMPHKPKTAEEADALPQLEPIIFKTEPIFEDNAVGFEPQNSESTAQQTEETAAAPQQKASARNRRRRRRSASKPEGTAAVEAKPEGQPKRQEAKHKAEPKRGDRRSRPEAKGEQKQKADAAPGTSEGKTEAKPRPQHRRYHRRKPNGTDNSRGES